MPDKKRAKKRFGQHFLNDPYVIQQIIAAINPNTSDQMLEIGPGLGVLTRLLIEHVQELTCLEIDNDLITTLNNAFSQFKNFRLIHTDALKFDLNTLYFGGAPGSSDSSGELSHNTPSHIPAKSLRVVGNLPYNISTPLLFHLLDYAPLIKDMHFMLQKEVVDRITAEPNTKDFGRLSIMIQYFCKTTNLFTVDARAFSPPPKVQSAFIRLIPYETLPFPVRNFKLFESLILQAFNQRRKMLSTTFKQYLKLNDFQKCDLDPKARPEALSVEQWTKLCNYIDSMGAKGI